MVMTSALFELVSYDDTLRRNRRGVSMTPQLMEFPVNPELAPFLVSSSRSVTWVQKASKEGLVRAAVRPRAGLEAETIAAIVELSPSLEWGNVHPLTTLGIEACVAHLNSYGLAELEMLVSPLTDLTEVETSVPRVQVPWMPVNAAVLVPVDRSFVGTLGSVGPERAVLVVHNASRGVAVAWNP
jgi:hypothetical protein